MYAQNNLEQTNTHADRFADEIRVLGGLDTGPETDRVLDAFRTVPRETFAGPGPWAVRSVFYDMVGRQTPDADPRWLYHCVLVALDEDKGINIGEPSFWARVLSRASVQTGARVLQVGAGVGYYTAILKHLIGYDGCVVAYEVDETLLARAKKNLEGFDGIEVRHGNAAQALTDKARFDVIVSFAGVTHVPDRWRRALTPSGRLLLPMTGRTAWGAMVLAREDKRGFLGETLGQCGFYPCAGARDEREAERLDNFWNKTVARDGGQFRFEMTRDGTRYVKV